MTVSKLKSEEVSKQEKMLVFMRKQDLDMIRFNIESCKSGIQSIKKSLTKLEDDLCGTIIKKHLWEQVLEEKNGLIQDKSI